MVFKPVAKFLLDEIFMINTFNIKIEEKMSLIKKSMELSYKSFNTIQGKYFGLNLTHYERTIYSYLSSSNYFNFMGQNMEIEIGNSKILIDLTTANYEEKMFPGTLIELIQTFKENSMIIYDAILSDKRIMFIGDQHTSCHKLSNFILHNLLCHSHTSPNCTTRQ